MLRARDVVLLASTVCAVPVLLYLASCLPDLPFDAPASIVDEASPEASLEASLEASPLEASAPRCGDGVIDLPAEQCDPGPAAGDAGSPYCSMSCQVLCDAGFVWPRNNHCYALAGKSADFDSTNSGAAKTLCTNLGGHVVTFASDEEFGAVASHFADGRDAGFWVGMGGQGATQRYLSVVDTYEPGWSPQCAGCFVRALDAGQELPHAEGSLAVNCVRSPLDPDAATWEQLVCTAVGPAPAVLCEREPDGVLSTPCDAGTCIDLAWTHGKKRYVAGGAAMQDPQDAVSACASVGGTLVVLQSRDEREELWRELLQLDVTVRPQSVWIGLSAAPEAGAGDDAWVWEDGTPAAGPGAYPPPWGIMEPMQATPGQRVFLSAAGPTVEPGIDNTLVNTSNTGSFPFPVCQIVLSSP